MIFLTLPVCQEPDVRMSLMSACPFIQDKQIKAITIVAASRE